MAARHSAPTPRCCATCSAACKRRHGRRGQETSARSATTRSARPSCDARCVVVTATQYKPPALAAATPAGESSNTTQNGAATPISRQARRYPCGSGLPAVTSSAVTITAKSSSRPSCRSLGTAYERPPEVTSPSGSPARWISRSSRTAPGNGSAAGRFIAWCSRPTSAASSAGSRPGNRSSSANTSAPRRPTNCAMSSSVYGTAFSSNNWRKAACEPGSLSTIVPSRSKMAARAGTLACVIQSRSSRHAHPGTLIQSG